MKIIALDWGQKRIGVAVGDTVSRIPFPRDFIVSDASALTRVKALYQAEKADKIVLGLPRQLDGAEGASAEKVRAFAQKLQKEIICEIEFFDERFTSKVAQSYIQAGAHAKHKREKNLKTEVDSLSASELLRNYFVRSK